MKGREQAGNLVSALGYAGLAFVDRPWQGFVCSPSAAAGFAVAGSANQLLSLTLVTPEQRAASIALRRVANNFGMGAGATVAGFIVASAAGAHVSRRRPGWRAITINPTAPRGPPVTSRIGYTATTTSTTDEDPDELRERRSPCGGSTAPAATPAPFASRMSTRTTSASTPTGAIHSALESRGRS